MKQVREETGIVHLRTAHRTDIKSFLLASDLSPLPLVPNAVLVDEWLYYGCIYVDGLRLRENRELQEGQVLRLHTRRKSYVTGGKPLSDCLIVNEEEFVVIDKPSGVPTHPTLDNYVDNVQMHQRQRNIKNLRETEVIYAIGGKHDQGILNSFNKGEDYNPHAPPTT